MQAPSAGAARRARRRSPTTTRERPAARVVIVDRARLRARRHERARLAAPRASPRGRRSARRSPGDTPRGVRHSKTLHERLLYVAVPIASGGTVHGAVRITLPDLDGRRAHPPLLAHARGDRCRRARGAPPSSAARLARFVTRPLRGLEDGGGGGRRRRSRRARARARGPAGGALARRASSTRPSRSSARLLRSQDEFVADASHELRTPLTALRLRLENRRRRRDALARGRSALRLSSTACSRWRARTPARRSAEAVDAAACVRERVETWRPLAASATCGSRSRSTVSVPVRAAPQRLVQVLDNLLANALEHAPRRSDRHASRRSSAPPWVELHVRDEGPGMTAEQRERAFDRFWRAATRPGRLRPRARDRPQARRRRRGRGRARVGARRRHRRGRPSPARRREPASPSYSLTRERASGDGALSLAKRSQPASTRSIRVSSPMSHAA